MVDYATLLGDHITLTCRSIDRLFLQAYIPKLQSAGQVCQFLNRRGFNIPSSAAFGQIGEAHVAAIHRWAEAEGVPIRYFAKGENKEKIAEPLLRAAAEAGGDGKVVLIGIAQEKASAWRSWKAKGQEKAAHPHMEWGRQMVFINHFYTYLWDPEWGPAFWKTTAYAPYPIWLWLNGHSWAKRQLDKAGIAYEALDNGFRWCADPATLQRICNRLGANAVHTFFWRWFHRLPSPFTPDDLQAGYAYELAFRQFEVSDTRVFDRPQAGRAFFEGVIRDHLDLGRPDQVVLIFDRKLLPRTPGRFVTKVITRGVDPQLSCTYKSSRLKQYFKLAKALRTETVISDTRDFGIGRRVCAKNWTALRAVGETANRRLCDAEAQTAQAAPDVVTLTHVTRPSTTPDGLHAPSACFRRPAGYGTPRVARPLQPPAGRLHQRPTGGPGEQPVGSALLQPSGDLRSAPAPPQGPDQPCTRRTLLSAHPIRATRSRAVHQGPWPSLGPWSRSHRPSCARRPRPTQSTCHRLATVGPRTQRLRRPATSRRLKLDLPVNIKLGKPS